MGILNPWNLQIIIDNATVPVLVDAGVGTASDAAIAMELGCDGVLMNTAIAAAHDPVLMASAMKKAVAGRARSLSRRAHGEETLQRRAQLAGRRRNRARRRFEGSLVKLSCNTRRFAASCCARVAFPTRSAAR